MSSRFRRGGSSGGVIDMAEPGAKRPGRSTRSKAVIGVYVVLLVAAAVGVGTVAAKRASTIDLTSSVTPSDSAPTPTPTVPTPTTAGPTPTPSPTVTRRAARPKHTAPAKAQPSRPKSTHKSTPRAKRATARSETGATVATEMVLGSPYRLMNVATAKCMSSDGSTPLQAGCGASTGQQWMLKKTRTADGSSLYYVQHAAADQRCLNLPGNEETVQTAAIGVATCTKVANSANGNDEWRLKVVGPPYQGHTVYAVVNAISGLCLDVSGFPNDQSDAADGANYTAYRCQVEDGTWDDHLWIFS